MRDNFGRSGGSFRRSVSNSFRACDQISCCWITAVRAGPPASGPADVFRRICKREACRAQQRRRPGGGRRAIMRCHSYQSLVSRARMKAWVCRHIGHTGSLGPPQCAAPRQRAVILNGVKDLAQTGRARYLACVFQARIVRSLAALGMTREWDRQRCIRDD